MWEVYNPRGGAVKGRPLCKIQAMGNRLHAAVEFIDPETRPLPSSGEYAAMRMTARAEIEQLPEASRLKEVMAQRTAFADQLEQCGHKLAGIEARKKGSLDGSGKDDLPSLLADAEEVERRQQRLRGAIAAIERPLADAQTNLDRAAAKVNTRLTNEHYEATRAEDEKDFAELARVAGPILERLAARHNDRERIGAVLTSNKLSRPAVPQPTPPAVPAEAAAAAM